MLGVGYKMVKVKFDSILNSLKELPSLQQVTDAGATTDNIITVEALNTDTYNANDGTNLFSWDGAGNIEISSGVNVKLAPASYIYPATDLQTTLGQADHRFDYGYIQEIHSTLLYTDYVYGESGNPIYVYNDWNGQDANSLTNWVDVEAGSIKSDNYNAADGTSLFSWDGNENEISFSTNLNLHSYRMNVESGAYIGLSSTTGRISWTQGTPDFIEIEDADLDLNSNNIVGVNYMYSSYVSVSNYLISDTLNAHSTVMTLLDWDGSTLNLMPNAEADIELFAESDVGDDENGKKLRLWRRAAEGNTYMDFYIDSSNKGYIKLYTSSSILYLDPISANGDVILEANGTGYLRIGNNTGGDFYVGGDGSDSEMLAVYNNLIFGWSRKTLSGTHTIKFQGTNNNGTFTYFQVGGDINSRLTEFFGTSEFGGTTNYATFSSNGELTLVGTARVLRDLWIDTAGIKAPGAKPATEVSHGNLETAAWQFSNEGVEANQESVSWRTAPPYDMDRTEGVTIRIGWSSASTGNVKWQLEYRWLAEDEDTTQGAEETLTVVDAASATANGIVVTDITGINAPSPTDVSIMFRLTRLSADAQDTISDTVELHGICFNYVSNKLGESL